MVAAAPAGEIFQAQHQILGIVAEGTAEQIQPPDMERVGLDAQAYT